MFENKMLHCIAETSFCGILVANLAQCNQTFFSPDGSVVFYITLPVLFNYVKKSSNANQDLFVILLKISGHIPWMETYNSIRFFCVPTGPNSLCREWPSLAPHRVGRSRTNGRWFCCWAHAHGNLCRPFWLLAHQSLLFWWDGRFLGARESE